MIDVVADVVAFVGTSVVIMLLLFIFDDFITFQVLRSFYFQFYFPTIYLTNCISPKPTFFMGMPTSSAKTTTSSIRKTIGIKSHFQFICGTILLFIFFIFFYFLAKFSIFFLYLQTISLEYNMRNSYRDIGMIKQI
jgi:hypothetical protein